MKKTQKGITLVALIITIIVLLILAVVAIRAVQNDGIIQYAKNARTDYEKAQDKEQDILEYYESYLSGTVGQWKKEGATLTRTNADGTKTQVKIGDYVNYNEGSYTHTPDTAKGAGISKASDGYGDKVILNTSELSTENLSWRVLGVNEQGELELISADPTTQKLYLANDEGYVYAEENLNNFCNDLYGQGTNSEGKKVSTGARSLNVNDINKLTNYDPTTYSGYGNKWTFKYPTDAEVSASTTGLTKNMWYKKEKSDGTLLTDWKNITSSTVQTFKLPGETTAISSTNPGTREVTLSYYYYDISTNLTTEDGFTSEETTLILNMITKGTSSANIVQWLASRCVRDSSTYVTFNVRHINGKVFGNIYTYGSNETYKETGYSVRPVVTLSSDVSLTGSGSDVGSTSNMWNIS